MAYGAFKTGLALVAGLLMVSETAAGSRATACYEPVTRPAVWKTITETVQVRPASTVEVIVPAVYQTRTRTVEIEPAQIIAKVTPAVVKTVHRKAMIEPAGTRWEWRRIHGKKVLCKVETKARYGTVAETVVVHPEKVRHVKVAARHGKVEERVLVRAASVKTVVVPAEYRTVTRRVQVEAGGTEWRPIRIKGHCKD